MGFELVFKIHLHPHRWFQLPPIKYKIKKDDIISIVLFLYLNHFMDSIVTQAFKLGGVWSTINYH